MRAQRLVTMIATVAIAAGALTAISPAPAQAAAEPFDPGHLISDSLMFDGNSMSVAQIQKFLDVKGKKCKSTSTAKCLKDITVTTTAKEPTTLRCLTAIPKKTKQTAAQVIFTVARACNVSPQVLLVTLQKEQGLVSSVSPPPESKYKIATGYGCPDGDKCATEFFGFFNQTYWAARAFQAYRNPANFASYQPGVKAIRYHPDPSDCGTLDVDIQNIATTALYTYTPYTPNAAALANPYKTGDKCSSYGNRNFWAYYNDWFGNTGAGDNVLKTATSAALTFDGERWMLPAATPRLLSTLAPLDAPATVSTAYFGAIPEAGLLSPLVKSSNGSYSILANSKRYTLQTCFIALGLGFDCANAATVPEELLAKIPSSDALETAASAIAQTAEGQKYLLGNAMRRELVAGANAEGASPAATLLVDSAVLAAIPYGLPYAPTDTLISIRGTQNFVIRTATASYTVPGRLLTQTGMAAWFTKSTGVIDAGSVAALPGVGALPLVFSDATSTYLVSAKGKRALTEPEQWSANPAVLDAGLVAKMPADTALTAPRFVRSTSSTAISLVASGERRAVASATDRTAIAKQRAISTATSILPDDTLASITPGAALVPSATIVKITGSSASWLIDGDSRIPITASQAAELKKSPKARVISAAIANGYPVAEGTALPGVICGESSYLAISGVLRAVTPDVATAYGPNYGFRTLDPTTCVSLTKSSTMGTFIKFGSSYFEMVDGTRVSLTKAKYTAAVKGEIPARVVSKYFARLNPVAR